MLAFLVQGTVDFSKVAEMACRLRDIGCYEVSLGDTIGVGTPPSLYKLLKVLATPQELKTVSKDEK